MHSLLVIKMFADAEISADYRDQIGRLQIRQDDVLLRKWFPPNSWVAIASVSCARNPGICPNAGGHREREFLS
jgi:hypothetical protein